ncbi:Podovirus DNA encapsidation protein (Gp16) [compost metagenome]
MSKYISFEYLTQNNPNPDGIQYKGLFGNRSIGKTHGVLRYVYRSLKDNEAFMILRRNKLELNFQPFVTKYSAAFDTDWQIDGNTIVENRDKVIGYFSALSLAERSKHMNFDSPYVTHIIVDEVFAEKPNKNEFQQLETFITTLSRRTGHPFHPITVWLLGNFDYGYSPIMDTLGVFGFNGKKQKVDNGVYLFSDMPSPANVLNVRSPLIKEIEIRQGNEPVLEWTYLKQSYGLYDMGTHMYIANIPQAKVPYDFTIRQNLVRMAVRKVGIPRVYVANYDCLRFLDDPALKITM